MNLPDIENSDTSCTDFDKMLSGGDNNQWRIKEKEPLLARIISNILHPIFMAVYGVALLFVFTDFSYIFAGRFLLFMLPIFILTCAVPASTIFVLKQLNVIDDYRLLERRDRTIPFIITLLSYVFLFYVFHSNHFYAWFQAMMLAPIIILVIAAIVNLYWKISAHMMGIGCLLGCVLSISYNIKGINPYLLFIILFILAGALGTSRLILKRHTSAQVYIGFLVGFIISYTCIYWGARIAYI